MQDATYEFHQKTTIDGSYLLSGYADIAYGILLTFEFIFLLHLIL